MRNPVLIFLAFILAGCNPDGAAQKPPEYISQTGDRGSQGDKGDPGLKGQDGTIGPKGDTGLPGKDGLNAVSMFEKIQVFDFVHKESLGQRMIVARFPLDPNQIKVIKIKAEGMPTRAIGFYAHMQKYACAGVFDFVVSRTFEYHGSEELYVDNSKDIRPLRYCGDGGGVSIQPCETGNRSEVCLVADGKTVANEVEPWSVWPERRWVVKVLFD